MEDSENKNQKMWSSFREWLRVGFIFLCFIVIGGVLKESQKRTEIEKQFFTEVKKSLDAQCQKQKQLYSLLSDHFIEKRLNRKRKSADGSNPEYWIKSCSAPIVLTGGLSVDKESALRKVINFLSTSEQNQDYVTIPPMCVELVALLYPKYANIMTRLQEVAQEVNLYALAEPTSKKFN